MRENWSFPKGEHGRAKGDSAVFRFGARDSVFKPVFDPGRAKIIPTLKHLNPTI